VYGDFEDLETGQRFGGKKEGEEEEEEEEEEGEEGTDDELEAQQDAELARLAKKVALKEQFNADFDSGKVHQSSGVMDSDGVGEGGGGGRGGGKRVGRKSRKEEEEEDAALDEEERQALLLAAKLKEDQKARNQAEFAEDGDAHRLKYEGFRQVNTYDAPPPLLPSSSFRSPQGLSKPGPRTNPIHACIRSSSSLSLPPSFPPRYRAGTSASASRASRPSSRSTSVPPSLWWWGASCRTRPHWGWAGVG
jgi:hypothetical protein